MAMFSTVEILFLGEGGGQRRIAHVGSQQYLMLIVNIRVENLIICISHGSQHSCTDIPRKSNTHTLCFQE